MTDDRRWVRVAAIGDVSADEPLAVAVEGRKLAVFMLEDGAVHVTSNVCTHEYALLTDGWYEDGEIECPLHAGRFDVRNGKAMCQPLTQDLETFPVEMRGDEIFVGLPPASA